MYKTIKDILSSGLFSILIVIMAIGVPINISAQETQSDPESTKRNIVEQIETESGELIKIEIPAYILEKLMALPRHGSKHMLKPGINRVSGWRIQVFSDGRNQHSLEARANARGSAILARFPKYRGQIYSFSKSPNWYTRVGNFTTIQEANAALAELKRAFPSFAAEMRAVKCQIVIIK